MGKYDVSIASGTTTGGIAVGDGAIAAGANSTIVGVGAAHDAGHLASLLKLLQPHIGNLPPETRPGAESLVARIEKESRQPAPSRSAIESLLKSLQVIAEGAIAGIIANFLSPTG